MTMYLPNPDLHPTGSEPAEFIDTPSTAEDAGKARAPTRRLDLQTRLDITRWAQEYISGLVENHNGDPEDVRSIIHRLHDQTALTDGDGSL